jgi:hypothetical protein
MTVLPPLGPKSSSLKSLPGDPTSLTELKSQILRLYPRVQSLEDDLLDLRNNLPLSLGQSILQLNRDVKRLQSDSNPDMAAQEVTLKLIEVESDCLLELDKAMKSSTTAFDERLQKLEKDMALRGLTRVHETSPDPLRGFEIVYAQYKSKTSSQITALADRLSALDRRDESKLQFLQISARCESHERSIARFTRELGKIREQVANVNAQWAKEAAPRTKQAEESRPSQNSVPNLSPSVQKVREKITETRTGTAAQIAKLQKRVAAARESLELMGGAISGLVESTIAVEQKARDVDIASQQLTNRMMIFETLEEGESQAEIIDALTAKLTAIHAQITAEIETVRRRLSECQKFIPGR